MKNLADVRDRCDFVGEIAGNDPGHAKKIVLESLPLAVQISPCAESEVLGSLGMIHRKLGDYTAAAAAFTQALAACDCEQCFPRVRRRQAYLLRITGDHQKALEYVDEAILGFSHLGEFRWSARCLFTRSVVLYASGDVDEAVIFARRACRSIRTRDAGHYLGALNFLAYLLTITGQWAEASELLSRVEGTVRSLQGYRILKRCVRWVRALAEAQNGDRARAIVLLGRLLEEMLGRGLTVPRAQAEKERTEALKASRATPLDVAAVLSDYAAVGGKPKRIAAAASEVLALNPEGENIRALLIELRDAAKSREDILPHARAVRNECPAAPALPPCLAA